MYWCERIEPMARSARQVTCREPNALHPTAEGTSPEAGKIACFLASSLENYCNARPPERGISVEKT